MKISSYEGGECVVEAFWEQCKGHVNLEKEYLNYVKVLVQTILNNSTQLPPGSIVDLYQIMVELATEVMFFECKLQELGVKF